VGRVTADAIYDSIGVGYARVRQPDPRIERQIHAALGSAQRVLNVGAGAGSYEPTDRVVVAVEPSQRMIDQRPPDASRLVVRAFANELPFDDDAFDAAMALLTVHHWPDASGGLREVRRATAGPVVVLTFDHAVHATQWLVTDYLPSMVEFDADVPSPSAIADALGGGEVSVVPVPADCRDGFCHAWWRRPDAYLDPRVRAGISGIARLPTDVVDEAMARLAVDLTSGRWHATHQSLLTASEIDAGYRLVVSRGNR
jgi:SAM-dependent methyltransferase